MLGDAFRNVMLSVTMLIGHNAKLECEPALVFGKIAAQSMTKIAKAVSQSYSRALVTLTPWTV